LAWREKVTLCLLIFSLSAIAVGFIVILPMALCPPMKLYKPEEFAYHQGTATGDDIWMGIRGYVYDVSSFAKQGHGAGMTSFGVTLADMQNYAGQDVSYLFPLPLTESCAGLVSSPVVSVENNMTLLNMHAVHVCLYLFTVTCVAQRNPSTQSHVGAGQAQLVQAQGPRQVQPQGNQKGRDCL
jgi:chitin synthase